MRSIAPVSTSVRSRQAKFALQQLQRYVSALVLLLLMPGLSGCRTKIVTNHVPPPAALVDLPAEGIYYYLPKTIVRVTIPITQTTKKPGTYGDIAPYFFPDANPATIITAKSDAYSVDATAVTVATRGLKDAGQMYVLKPNGGIFSDTNFHFVMNDQSVPSAISAQVNNNSVDFALTTIESTAALFAKAATGGVMSKATKTVVTGTYACANKVEFTPQQASNYALLDKPQQILFCTISPEQRDIVFTPTPSYASVLQNWIQATYTTPAAEEAFLRAPDGRGLKAVFHFLSARDSFTALSTMMKSPIPGSDTLASVSSDTYKAYSDAVAAKMKSLTAAFFGTTTVNPAATTAAFDIDQPAAASQKYNLMTLGETSGVCGVSVSAPPTRTVTLASASPDIASPCTTTSTFSLTIDGGSGSPGVAGAPSGESGLRYRIPGLAAITLSNGTSELVRQSFPIAQFGYIASLPKNMGGMKTQYEAKFDAATGALLEITTANAAVLNADLMKRVAGSAGTAIATQQAVDKQNAPAKEATPLEQTQNERKLKQEQLRLLMIDNCLKDPTQSGCSDLLVDE